MGVVVCGVACGGKRASDDKGGTTFDAPDAASSDEEANPTLAGAARRVWNRV